MTLFHLLWVCTILVAQPVPTNPYTGEGLKKPEMIETEVHRDRYFLTPEEADAFIEKAPKNCTGWAESKEEFVKKEDCPKCPVEIKEWLTPPHIIPL